MMAAARADYDAKVAELMADLEGTRGEKERADTDLAFLKVLCHTLIYGFHHEGHVSPYCTPLSTFVSLLYRITGTEPTRIMTPTERSYSTMLFRPRDSFLVRYCVR